MKRRNGFAERSTGFILGSLCLGLVIGGCAATQQARKAEPRGFLGDYSQLEEGEKGQALLVYMNPRADWAKYDKMFIDPVTVWYDEDTKEVPEDEAQVLADYLDSSLHQFLGEDYEIVDDPGPGVLRVRVAITEAKGSRKVANFVSTYIPQLRALSTVKRLATGTHAFVGRAGIEAELLDSMTEERLAAAVDRRVGGKPLKGPFGTWGHVQAAFDYWAQRLRDRLRESRGA